MKEKNVILITCDALRADHLGFYSSNPDISPNIDNFAREGIVFRRAFSNGPSTPPSFSTILTSTYRYGHFKYPVPFEKKPLLSKIVKKHSYTPIAFSSNPFATLKGFDKGFYHPHKKRGETPYYELLNTVLNNVLITGNITPSPIKAFLGKIFGCTLSERIDEILPYDRAREINKKIFSYFTSQIKPFFLWIHYMEPHSPYLPPPKYLEELGLERISREKMLEVFYLQRTEEENDLRDKLSLYKKLYKAEIRYLDNEIGKLLKFLRNKNLLEETLFILTSDHGEAFGEHGILEHPAELYDELIHVPLIMRTPSELHKEIKQLTSLINIPPTICDFLNIPKPQTFQGRSLLPMIRGKKSMQEEGIISEADKKDVIEKICYRTENWKYIYNIRGKDEIYDLRLDPGEKENLINEKPEIRRKLKAKILEHRGKTKKSLSKRIQELRREINGIQF